MNQQEKNYNALVRDINDYFNTYTLSNGFKEMNRRSHFKNEFLPLIAHLTTIKKITQKRAEKLVDKIYDFYIYQPDIK